MLRVAASAGYLHALVFLSACQGTISEPGGAGGGSSGAGVGSSGAGGVGASTPLPGPSDEELRGQDPQLFDVALRYFPGQAAAASPKRIFRLTRAQLDLTTQHLLPEAYAEAGSPSSFIPRDPLQTNYEYAENLSIGQANFTPLTELVGRLASSAAARPATVLDCAERADQAACVEQATRAFVTRAFRGVVSEATLLRFVAHTRTSAAEGGLARAAQDLVQLTLTSPGYLFREEVQTSADGKLLPAQLLQSLSYTLADSPPEALGLQARLPSSDGDVALTVREILETPAARAKLLRFFMAWLEVKEPAELDISRTAFPELTEDAAAAMVEDTRSFLTEQLSDAAPLLGNVTEVSELLVADASSFLYGLPAPGGQRVKLDPAQRLGIFSLPAVIASHSGPTTTRLVKRGVFFTRKVMCLPLGQPPPEAKAAASAETMGSERERIESVTAEPRCAGCHAFINPFGFMQESYDAIGRFRKVDSEQRPVDPSISVSFLDEGPLAATTSVEALRGFTRSLRFQQCFTRQLFRFYTGRDETADDDPLLRQLFFDFVKGQRDIVRLLHGLASASLYNSRKEAP